MSDSDLPVLALEGLRGAALEGSPAGCVVVDEDGTVLLVNRAIERLFGYGREELIGKAVELLVPDAQRDAHIAMREGFAKAAAERPMGACKALFGRRKDGSLVPVEIGLSPFTTSTGPLVVASIVDIRARRDLERRVRQAEKMEAVGAMASGIAHDFNNMLLAIVGYTELARENLWCAAT